MSQYRRNISLLSCLILAALFGGQVHAQSLQDAQIGQQEFCNDTGMCNQGAHGPSPRAPDPCFLAQNAMRPCTSVRQQAPTPVGVDPNLIGTWKLPREGGDRFDRQDLRAQFIEMGVLVPLHEFERERRVLTILFGER